MSSLLRRQALCFGNELSTTVTMSPLMRRLCCADALFNSGNPFTSDEPDWLFAAATSEPFAPA